MRVQKKKQTMELWEMRELEEWEGNRMRGLINRKGVEAENGL